MEKIENLDLFDFQIFVLEYAVTLAPRRLRAASVGIVSSEKKFARTEALNFDLREAGTHLARRQDQPYPS